MPAPGSVRSYATKQHNTTQLRSKKGMLGSQPKASDEWQEGCAEVLAPAGKGMTIGHVHKASRPK